MRHILRTDTVQDGFTLHPARCAKGLHPDLQQARTDRRTADRWRAGSEVVGPPGSGSLVVGGSHSLTVSPCLTMSHLFLRRYMNVHPFKGIVKAFGRGVYGEDGSLVVGFPGNAGVKWKVCSS